MQGSIASIKSTVDPGSQIVKEQDAYFFKFFMNDSIHEGMRYQNKLYGLLCEFNIENSVVGAGFDYKQILKDSPVVISISNYRYKVWISLQSPYGYQSDSSHAVEPAFVEPAPKPTFEVFQVQSRTFSTANAMEVAEWISDRLHSGVKNLLIDLRSVSLMDTSGLAVLAATSKMVTKAGGRLALCSPNGQARMMLEMTYKLQQFEIYANPQEFENTALKRQAI